MSSHPANMTIKSKGCRDNIRAESALRFDIMKREKKQSQDWYRSILQGERHQYVDKSCPICMSSVRQKFYKCNQCLTKFGLKRHLICHVMKTHMRNKEMIVHEGQKSSTFVSKENCNTEKKILQTINIKKSNNDVVKNKRPRKVFTCGICGKTLTTSLILKTHLKSIHEKPKGFICNHCDKGFSQKHVLKMHISCVHEGNKRPKQKFLTTNAKCNLCEKSFSEVFNLNKYYFKKYQHSIGTHTCLNIQYAVEILIHFQKCVAMLCF